MPSASHVEVVLHALASHLASFGTLSWDGGNEGAGEEYTEATPWPTFLGPRMPVSPDRMLVLTPATATTDRGNVVQTVQVRGRDAADATPWAVLDKLQQIRDHMTPGGHPRSSFLMGGLPVSKVTLGADPQVLAEDAERRPGATLTLRIHSRRIAAP